MPNDSFYAMNKELLFTCLTWNQLPCRLVRAVKRGLLRVANLATTFSKKDMSNISSEFLWCYRRYLEPLRETPCRTGDVHPAASRLQMNGACAKHQFLIKSYWTSPSFPNSGRLATFIQLKLHLYFHSSKQHFITKPPNDTCQFMCGSQHIADTLTSLCLEPFSDNKIMFTVFGCLISHYRDPNIWIQIIEKLHRSSFWSNRYLALVESSQASDCFFFFSFFPLD